MADLFQLGSDERRLLALISDLREPQSVDRIAEMLGLELIQLLVMLAGDGALRAHGLVEVDEAAELGFLRATDKVYLARGMELIEGVTKAISDAALFSAQVPGITYVPAPLPGTEWARNLLPDSSGSVPQAIQIGELVRERLVTPHPSLLWLSQCPPEAMLALCQAIRLRLQRPVLLISGTALVGWPAAQVSAALRRLRRDADLRGAAVVVSEAQLLGGAWLAVTLPRPAGQTAPVVLCSSTTLPPLGLPPSGSGGGTALVPQLYALRPVAAASAAAGAPGSATEVVIEDPAILASRDDARRRAAMDAARAMGKPIPPELLAAAASAASAAASAAQARPTMSSPASAPPPPAAAAPTPSTASRSINPRLAAALAKAGLAPPSGVPEKSAPVHQSTAVQTPAPAAGHASAPADSEAAEPLPADDQPPLPLAEDAGPEELVRVARTTPNQQQKADVLRRLSGTKSPSVIHLFRTNSQSPHPEVRAAAEAGMASLFGANWNRTRAIVPPVQPPRGDDTGRGPGGAF